MRGSCATFVVYEQSTQIKVSLGAAAPSVEPSSHEYDQMAASLAGRPTRRSTSSQGYRRWRCASCARTPRGWSLVGRCRAARRAAASTIAHEHTCTGVAPRSAAFLYTVHRASLSARRMGPQNSMTTARETVTSEFQANRQVTRRTTVHGPRDEPVRNHRPNHCWAAARDHGPRRARGLRDDGNALTGNENGLRRARFGSIAAQ